MRRTNLLVGLCAALFALAPCAAFAETYLHTSLLMVMPTTHEVRGTISGGRDLTTDSGFGVAVAWGSRHENGWETELEFGYHATDADGFETADGRPLVWAPSDPNAYRTSTWARGDISTTSLMVNHYGTFGEATEPGESGCNRLIPRARPIRTHGPETREGPGPLGFDTGGARFRTRGGYRR